MDAPDRPPPGDSRQQNEAQRAKRKRKLERVSGAFRRRAASEEKGWLDSLAEGLAKFPRKPPRS